MCLYMSISICACVCDLCVCVCVCGFCVCVCVCVCGFCVCVCVHLFAVVPSMQDPSGHDNTMLGFRPFNDSSTSVHRPNIANPSLPNIFDGYQRNCSQSYYGCCPDGFTPAHGPQAQGCPQGSCIRA
ncbi:hypothetical protein ANANG_G00319460, partial [Anguilla anguilla]